MRDYINVVKADCSTAQELFEVVGMVLQSAEVCDSDGDALELCEAVMRGELEALGKQLVDCAAKEAAEAAATVREGGKGSSAQSGPRGMADLPDWLVPCDLERSAGGGQPTDEDYDKHEWEADDAMEASCAAAAIAGDAAPGSVASSTLAATDAARPAAAQLRASAPTFVPTGAPPLPTPLGATAQLTLADKLKLDRLRSRCACVACGRLLRRPSFRVARPRRSHE